MIEDLRNDTERAADALIDAANVPSDVEIVVVSGRGAHAVARRIYAREIRRGFAERDAKSCAPSVPAPRLQRIKHAW